MLNKQKYEKQQ